MTPPSKLLNTATHEALGLQAIYTMHLDRGQGKPSIHFDIVDFLPQSMEFQEETRLVVSDGAPKLVVKGGPQRVKLEKVTLAQWNCANMAIMDKFLQEGLLSTRGVREYMNYTYIMDEPVGICIAV